MNGNGGAVYPWLMDGGDKTLPMPSHAHLKAFLHEYYLHSRFEGAAGSWCPSYADLVTTGSMEQLEHCGWGCVGIYESNRGRAIYFDRSLRILNPDEAPAQIQRQAPNLTHITGAAW